MAKQPLENPALVDVSTSTPDRVVIGCKLAHGLIIDAETKPLYEARFGELVDSGERDLDRRIVLNGMSSLYITDTGVILPGSGGYGKTTLTGWQVEAWRDWYARHRDFAPVKAGLVFEAPDEAAANSEGENRRALKTGAERIDPDKLPAGVEKVDTKK